VVQLAAAGGHLLAIAYALRYAIAGDMAALKLTASHSKGIAGRSNSYITTITRAHRHVITGLALALIAGLAQLAAQLDYLPRSPIFWTKMLTLLLLLANGRIIQLTGRRLAASTGAGNVEGHNARDLRDLRFAALRSVFLWVAMILLGLMLTTVRPDA
jgi:hypothetical protein